MVKKGGDIVGHLPRQFSCASSLLLKMVAYEELFSLLALMKETIFFDISFEACVRISGNAGIAIHDYIFMKCNFCEICENNIL